MAAGLKDAAYSVSTTAEWVPRGVEQLEASVAEVDPEGDRVVTGKGQSVPHDFLIVATGLKLEELWLTWLMKEVVLEPTDLAMVRGEA